MILLRLIGFIAFLAGSLGIVIAKFKADIGLLKVAIILLVGGLTLCCNFKKSLANFKRRIRSIK